MTVGPFCCFERRHTNGTPINSWLLAAWHWRWSITWRWLLDWTPWSDTSDPRPLRWRFNKIGGGFVALGLPVVGTLYFAWQRNMKRRPYVGRSS
jgi:hypothetical protein